jgi:hypothetical protein
MSCYPPNTKCHKVGALVIHWCDAKENHMLMRVVGYTKSGAIKTRYVSLKEKHLKGVLVNDPENLHDPSSPEMQAVWRGEKPPQSEVKL